MLLSLASFLPILNCGFVLTNWSDLLPSPLSFRLGLQPASSWIRERKSGPRTSPMGSFSERSAQRPAFLPPYIANFFTRSLLRSLHSPDPPPLILRFHGCTPSNVGVEQLGFLGQATRLHRLRRPHCQKKGCPPANPPPKRGAPLRLIPQPPPKTSTRRRFKTQNSLAVLEDGAGERNPGAPNWSQHRNPSSHRLPNQHGR